MNFIVCTLVQAHQESNRHQAGRQLQFSALFFKLLQKRGVETRLAKEKRWLRHANPEKNSIQL
ncbi:hypothetical protein BUE76_16725 [Cnuella takakiae]|nr:hypothetical protein BUE76_16725 [Cnuella takakiae]